jgi:peptidoglycan/xylan/chitin deacetylase (PgdA/CDA1 family)
MLGPSQNGNAKSLLGQRRPLSPMEHNTIQWLSLGMFPVKMPRLVQVLWPRLLWRKPVQERVLYLTFDDGPTPGVTDWVLATLADHGAKATFFCIGDNVRKYPETLRKVQAAGHTIGNHTYHHLDLWKTPLSDYLDNAALCQQAILDATGTAPKYFRPPYGKMGLRAARRLSLHYQVVMWEIICGDWDAQIAPEVVTQNAIRNAQPGSIIVFHDSLKAEARMKPAVAALLQHFSAQGYRFEAL